MFTKKCFKFHQAGNFAHFAADGGYLVSLMLSSGKIVIARSAFKKKSRTGQL